MQSGIDNHLGVVRSTWFSDGALMGRVIFNDTERARQAEGMVARGEIRGVSAGYIVNKWEISDADGNVLDPETDHIDFDEDLRFTAVKWELVEVSIVSVPADADALIRNIADEEERDRVARTRARVRISMQLIDMA